MKNVKKQTFTQGIITLMFSQIFIKILGLIYKLFLTNKQGFGDSGNAIYSSSFQIYALFLTISSVGVPNAISKLVSEKYSIGDEKGATRVFKTAFAMFSIIGFISSVVLFKNASFIANNILQIPETMLTLQILAPSIFFVSIISVLRGYFNAKENMKPTANSQFIEQFVKTIITIIIIEYIYIHINVKEKTTIMVEGSAIALGVATILCFLYLLKYYKKDQVIKKVRGNIKQERIIQIIKNIIIVSAPITISVILGTINRNIDSFTVVRGLKKFMSSEEAKVQYGILSGKVETLITLPMSFNIALTTSLIPTIAAAKSRNCLKEVENKIRFSLILTFLIGLPASVGMFSFAKEILNLLFPNANAGAFIYQISSISIVFILLNQTITGIMQGLGKQLTPVISLFVGVLTKLGINIMLVGINPNKFILGGAAGAALGSVICYAVSLFFNIIVLRKNTKFKLIDYKIVLKIIFSTIIMILSSKCIFYGLNHIIAVKLSSILAIIFAITIYIICILNMKVLTSSGLKSLKLKKNTRKSKA